MHAESSTRWSRLLTILISILVLGGCGEGDGPTRILNAPVAPLPSDGGGEAFDSGLLTNGDFEAGIDPWIGNAANVIDDGGNLVNFADVAVAGQPFDVNLSQVLPITQGETYTLTFKARSNVTRTILAGIGLNEAPFTNDTVEVNLTPAWQTFTFEFNAGFGSANSRVLFDLGADTGQVLIDDVSLILPGSGGGAGSAIDPDVVLYATDDDPDLVIPDDYDEVTPFGSGSVIDAFYSDDETYMPVLSVFSGSGYGANVAQVGYIGFDAGFASAYGSLVFKAKGLPNSVIFVKLFDGVDSLRINLTSSGFSDALEDGWFQVSIPISSFNGVSLATGVVFESDNTAPEQFRMLLTDIGFIGSGNGGGGGGPFDDGLLTNGDFESGTNPWLLGVSNPIGAENVINEGGNNVFFVNVEAAGNSFDVNLSQKLAITPGETYTLTFKARSNVSRPIKAGIGQSGGSFFSATEDRNLTTAWQTFEIEVTATDDNGGGDFGEADSRVLFDMGQAVGEVYIDDVSLVVTGGGGTGGGPFDDGLLTNGDFEGGTDPWLLGVSNPIGAENVIDDGGNNVFFVNVEAAGNSFDVNLSQKLAITPGESYTLIFKARSNVNRVIQAGIGQSGGSFFSATVERNLTTAWQTFEIQLTATDDNGGGDFGEADSRVLFDMGQAVGEVYIDDVALVVAGAGGGGAGGFVNGDFETGDFTGWTPERVPANRGSVAVDNSGQGGRAGTVARLITDADVSSPNDILLSQVALGAGTIATGDEIDVSFDLYGSLSGAGGVVFVEVIFLNSAGEDEGGRNFVGPAAPYTPTTTWTTHSGTVIAGTGATMDGWDVSGGVTLQLKAACGAIDGCGVDASFDNVTFTISSP